MTRYPRGVRALAGVFALVASGGGCHVTSELESTHPGTLQRVRHPEQAVARSAILALADDGHLRFVEPRECPTEDVTEQLDTIEVQARPNLATFVVGVIATSAAAITTARGALGGDGALTALGVGGLAVGLPLAIGPWLGLDRALRAGPAHPALHVPGPTEACGDRPVAARAATLSASGIQVYGTIAADGTFAVSPFQLLDAYGLASVHAWDVSASVEGDGPPRTITAVIEGGALAKAAPEFFAHADFDSKIEPLRLVPNLASGPPRVSLTSTDTGPAVRVVLAVHNAGPGDTYALRGQITSSSPALDGRVIYIGHLPREKSAAREILIPLSAAAGAALRGATVDVSIELRDAHGTAPTTPFRFRGLILNDAPR